MTRASPETKARALPLLAAAIERAGPYGGADGADGPEVAAKLPASLKCLSGATVTEGMPPREPFVEVLRAGVVGELHVLGVGGGGRGARGGRTGGGGGGGNGDGGVPEEGGVTEEEGHDILAERALCRLVQASAAAAAGGGAR